MGISMLVTLVFDGGFRQLPAIWSCAAAVESHVVPLKKFSKLTMGKRFEPVSGHPARAGAPESSALRDACYSRAVGGDLEELRRHPWSCMLLRVRFHANSSPSRGAILFKHLRQPSSNWGRCKYRFRKNLG
jgi:hypothetical protein